MIKWNRCETASRAEYKHGQAQTDVARCEFGLLLLQPHVYDRQHRAPYIRTSCTRSAVCGLIGMYGECVSTNLALAQAKHASHFHSQKLLQKNIDDSLTAGWIINRRIGCYGHFGRWTCVHSTRLAIDQHLIEWMSQLLSLVSFHFRVLKFWSDSTEFELNTRRVYSLESQCKYIRYIHGIGSVVNICSQSIRWLWWRLYDFYTRSIRT